MDRFITRTKASCIVLGICLTILGLAFFINPVSALEFLTLCLGWIFLFAGIATVITYFARKDYERSTADIVVGILEIILGALVLVFPLAFMGYLFILLGAVVVITGIFDIVEALSMSKVEGSRWGVWLLLGIITLVFGIFLFMRPLFLAEFMMLFAGIALVYDGITEIIVGIRL